MIEGAHEEHPTAGRAGPRRDGEDAVQEELRREAAERDGIGGDTATDRNLSGSSTWVTLGDTDAGSPSPKTDAPDERGVP